MLDADTLADITEHGGDPAVLIAQARSSRSSLTDALKALGYTKLGARKKVEQALVAAAAEAGAGDVGDAPTAEDVAEPVGGPPPPQEDRAAPPPAAQAPPEPKPTRDADSMQSEGTAAFQAGRFAEAVGDWGDALSTFCDGVSQPQPERLASSIRGELEQRLVARSEPALAELRDAERAVARAMKDHVADAVTELRAGMDQRDVAPELAAESLQRLRANLRHFWPDGASFEVGMDPWPEVEQQLMVAEQVVEAARPRRPPSLPAVRPPGRAGGAASGRRADPGPHRLLVRQRRAVRSARRAAGRAAPPLRGRRGPVRARDAAD